MAITEDATITSNGQVTIPKPIRDRLALEEGTEVEFVLDDGGHLEVCPKKLAMERLRNIQRTLSDRDIDLEEMRGESKDAWRSHADREETV